MTDYDPRLVQLYDDDNPDGPDHDYFRALADHLEARTIVDLGCGTGILTVTFAQAGRAVVGIDPSANMLAFARSRPGAESVTWRLGTSGAIGKAEADLVVMSGNVAQHLTGAVWHEALRDICRGLRPGGVLAFESRNPGARAWEAWTREETFRSRTTPLGHLAEWYEVTSATDSGEVTFSSHTLLTVPGASAAERITEESTITFRSRDTVLADLAAAGFATAEPWGGWRRQPLQATSPLMVFEARRP